MKDESEKIGTLDGIIDREIERHPHNSALIEAFRPVIIGRMRILERLQLGEAGPFVLDELRFRGGVPVIGQRSLFQKDDPWKDVVLALIPAIKEGFPALSDDLGRLEDALRANKIAVYDAFKAGQDNGEDIINTWAASLSISASTIGLVLHQVSRIILEKRAGVIAELLPDGGWEKGYCPICGAYPSLSIIKEKLGERLLHCSHCGHDWRFSRVTCPYCEHEGQEGMNFFFIEDKAQESSFTCEKCRRYLITLSRMSDLNDQDLDISALGLAHLDMIMQEKKFVPMTITDWNVF